MSNPIVVDLSHHNPDPNWSVLKQNGTMGVILKATQGYGYVDPTLDDRYMAAIGEGLFVATYHFLEHGNVDQQMEHYVSRVDPTDNERLVLDYEDCDNSPSLDDLCRAVWWLKNETACEVTIYGGGKLKEELGNSYMHELSGTSLWIAQYTSAPAPDWPRGQWPTWSLWQYTDSADVVGISAEVDGNRWNGDPANLQAWFYRPIDPAPRPLPWEEAVVEIATRGPVKLVINGVAYDRNARGD